MDWTGLGWFYTVKGDSLPDLSSWGLGCDGDGDGDGDTCSDGDGDGDTYSDSDTCSDGDSVFSCIPLSLTHTHIYT